MIARRTFLLGSAATLVPLPFVSSCGMIAPTAAPVASSWFSQFAVALGATATVEVAKYGALAGIDKWEETWPRLVEEVMGDGYRYYGDARYRTAVSPFLLLQVFAVSVDPETYDDPANSDVVVILKKGKQGVRLPSWAWLTMTRFAETYIESGRAADRVDRKSLLGFAITPSGKRESKVETKGNLVSAVTYKTAVGGYVELAKIENEDHSFTSRIKISAMPDDTSSPRVDEFPLPEGF